VRGKHDSSALSNHKTIEIIDYDRYDQQRGKEHRDYCKYLRVGLFP